MAAAHYIEALRLQAKAARMHAIFGGKNPHPQSLVVGGVTCVRDLNPDRIAEFLYLTRETQNFVKKGLYPRSAGGGLLLQKTGAASAAAPTSWPMATFRKAQKNPKASTCRGAPSSNATWPTSKWSIRKW